MNPGSVTSGPKIGDILHRSLVGGIVILSSYLIVSNVVMGTNFYNMHKEGQVRRSAREDREALERAALFEKPGNKNSDS
jgi:hypothetical protein